MNICRCFLWLAALFAGGVFAAPSCDTNQPVPRTWKTVGAAAAFMRVPTDFVSRKIDTFDSLAFKIANKDIAFSVEYGLPATKGQSPGERVIQLDGGDALMEDNPNGFLVRWPELGPYRTLGILVEFSQKKSRKLACQILGGVRLLGSIDQLAVVELHAKDDKRSVVMEVRNRYRHTFVEGDYATLAFGEVRTINEEFVEIVEVMPNGKGGWKEQVTRLKPPTK